MTFKTGRTSHPIGRLSSSPTVVICRRDAGLAGLLDDAFRPAAQVPGQREEVMAPSVLDDQSWLYRLRRRTRRQGASTHVWAAVGIDGEVDRRHNCLFGQSLW